MNKRGIGWDVETVGKLLFVLVVFLVLLGVVRYFREPDYELGVKEQICRMSIGLSESPVLGMKPICKTTRIKDFDEGDIKKYKQRDETMKEATIRFILEKMRTCGKIVSGTQKENLITQEKKCYVCYTLETAETGVPSVKMSEFFDYAKEIPSPRGLTYMYELQHIGPQKDLEASIILQDNLFVADRDYAIVYMDKVSADVFDFLLPAAVGAGACFLTGGLGCVLSIAATTTASGFTKKYFNLFDVFGSLGEDKDILLFTDVVFLDNQCTHVIS